MRAKLVGVPGSHPVISAELMLRYKGIEFSRLDLPNITHRVILPLMRYRGHTVPVINLDGRRISGTMRIARALDALRPDPPLFPAEHRASVEGAEAWADSALQDGVRQLARWAVSKDPDAIPSFVAGAQMGPITPVVRRTAPLLRPLIALQMRKPDAAAQAVMEALPAQLDRVDALLEEGVIGGERPNAADFQIAPCVRLMMTFDQLRDHIDARPAGRHARRYVPDYTGRFKAVIPKEWMPF
jgi:glutathione S-transferase